MEIAKGLFCQHGVNRTIGWIHAMKSCGACSQGDTCSLNRSIFLIKKKKACN